MSERENAVCKWARDLMAAKDFVIVDTETTATDHTAEIVQIVVVNAWRGIAFSSLVKPTNPINENGRAFEVNGISNAMVENAPSFEKVHGCLERVLYGRKIIAYNSEFDARMVFQCCERRVLPLPESSPWQYAMLKFAEYVGQPGRYGSYRWHKLIEACGVMGITDRNWHDAAGDALATYDLIAALAGKYEAEA